MVLQLDPGTSKAGPELKEGDTIRVSGSRADVNFDEILASLDRDTRDYLRLLVADGATALGDGGGRDLADTFRRFDPLSRHTAKATRLVAKRRTRLKRLMTNLSLLADELGTNDDQLRTFVRQSAAVFRRFADQNENLGDDDRAAAARARSRRRPRSAGWTRLGTTLDRSLTRPPADRGGVRADDAAAAPVPRHDDAGAGASSCARSPAPRSRRRATARPSRRGPRRRDAEPARVDRRAERDRRRARLRPARRRRRRAAASCSTCRGQPTTPTRSSRGQDGIGPMRRGLVLVSCGSLQLLESLWRLPR